MQMSRCTMHGIELQTIHTREFFVVSKSTELLFECCQRLFFKCVSVSATVDALLLHVVHLIVWWNVVWNVVIVLILIRW